MNKDIAEHVSPLHDPHQTISGHARTSTDYSILPVVKNSPHTSEQLLTRHNGSESPYIMYDKGSHRKLGDTTAIGVAGFLLCTTPLSMQLLGWHGADQLGLAISGAYFWIGGMLLTLSGIGLWINGDTFTSTVFTTFGGFFFTFGATLMPSYNAFGSYGADPKNVAEHWTSMAEFHSTFAFFLVGMTLLCTVYFIASVKTSVTFCAIFACLIPCFSCLSASYFALGSGSIHTGEQLQYAGAGILLVISLIGWYEFLALLLLAVEFPFALPLGDLSHKLPSHESKAKSDKEA